MKKKINKAIKTSTCSYNTIYTTENLLTAPSAANSNNLPKETEVEQINY
jgi:hypothetical protein